MYLYGVMLLSSLVELLLLLAANRLTGCPPAPGRCLLAALLGGLYSGACLLPQLQCISHALWRCGFLCLLGIVAFGWHSYSLRRTALFLFLSSLFFFDAGFFSSSSFFFSCQTSFFLFF